jgi:uncharacterized protein (TIGR02246 family)
MTQDVRTAIESANQTFMAAFKRADAAAIAACYTRDAQLLPANSDVVQGLEAIREFWQGALELGMTEVRLETRELDVYGDTAVEVGRYELHAGGTVADRGKYIVVWKNAEGGWKLHRDIWTTSQPAATVTA